MPALLAFEDLGVFDPPELSEGAISTGIERLLDLHYSITIEVRNPAVHLVQPAVPMQEWHQDQSGTPMDMVVWASVYPTEFRRLCAADGPWPELDVIPTEALHVYRFANALYQHRQPILTRQQLSERWFVRILLMYP